ncbi:uncharacterized protein ALTATR162_LOCUS9694 [Alternaria atra]|uniref:Uncharacterized protein n=1 Tax=Alternaria atra TaxID=119953 RepID=A0A8J2I7F0_9PLEO|nr:uncharacterized protein ALTATR162_LOCUS9694 [Alternaria atra]CAG5181302.1 unnamed protein product [Alternaria atra]
MRANSAIAFVLPLLAAGAHLGHRHSYDHADIYHRAVKTNIVVVTETAYTTLTVDLISSSPESSSCAVATTSAAPPPSITVKLPEKGPSDIASASASSSAVQSSSAPPKSPSSNGNHYAPLNSEPHTAIIVNSCDYDVYVSSIGDVKTCGPGNICKLVPANSTYSEPIRTCYKSGISLKVSKTEAMTQVMQFEYTVWDDKTTMSYDISYLDCQVKTDATTFDFSACVGHEKGIQAAAKDGPVYSPTRIGLLSQTRWIVKAPGYCGWTNIHGLMYSFLL